MDLQNANFIYFLFHTPISLIFICLCIARFAKCKLWLFHTTIFIDFNLSSHRFTKCKLNLFHTPISLILHLQNANFVYFIHLSSMIFICLCLDLQIANSDLSAHRFGKCLKWMLSDWHNSDEINIFLNAFRLKKN